MGEGTHVPRHKETEILGISIREAAARLPNEVKKHGEPFGSNRRNTESQSCIDKDRGSNQTAQVSKGSFCLPVPLRHSFEIQYE